MTSGTAVPVGKGPSKRLKIIVGTCIGLAVVLYLVGRVYAVPYLFEFRRAQTYPLLHDADGRVGRVNQDDKDLHKALDRMTWKDTFVPVVTRAYAINGKSVLVVRAISNLYNPSQFVTIDAHGATTAHPVPLAKRYIASSILDSYLLYDQTIELADASRPAPVAVIITFANDDSTMTVPLGNGQPGPAPHDIVPDDKAPGDKTPGDKTPADK